MKQNKYDDDVFFEKYSQMDRSKKGLEGSGEWHEFQKLLPDLTGKRILDVGCGYGWHCRYAMEQGALSAVGIDISEKMLSEAEIRTDSNAVRYICMPIEEIDFPVNSFDVVISSLALHYVESFSDICDKIRRFLVSNGSFVFSVEHPVFTAEGRQEWHFDEAGNMLHWPVDNYFEEGLRTTNFLGEDVMKYHKTLTTYVNTLIRSGFEITGLVEPEPEKRILGMPGMANELRRPMMLLVSAKKTDK
ncbi:bifunctional 2-polyprenyl-6-hydroxyphenol methylase/3-demethylubiquinol 3-O-methyltransferase UbiG [Paenibacillus sp. NEAU-GSW1]|uniref:class I SAM-dependent methyltransferase n=1 Tax=Paenibacillus sp. NEAU-GSW1 TaxID=2682486 RepID=UPI0012E204D5|nr:class I SAM-dependent methyltransferase [Paenibacillus sp. NEAU-GSW1]MUT67354.1 methyltransferase domain-containing protein [Paenibacillus sp. NEAU-GSW1]